MSFALCNGEKPGLYKPLTRVITPATASSGEQFRCVSVYGSSEQRRQIDTVRHDDATVLIYVGVSVRPATIAEHAMHRCTLHKESLRDTIRQSWQQPGLTRLEIPQGKAGTRWDSTARAHVADYIDDAIGVGGSLLRGTLGPGGAESRAFCHTGAPFVPRAEFRRNGPGGAVARLWKGLSAWPSS